MTGTGLGIGSPFGQFGQTGGSPFGGYGMTTPFQLQTPPYLQSLQQIPGSSGTGQPFGQQSQHYAQLQQLLQILPQQLGQVHQLLHQQFQALQQLVQVVPQQLQHIQQLLQILPQQIQQLQMQSQQPFGAQATPGIGGFGPWQQSGAGIGSPAFGGQGGPVM